MRSTFTNSPTSGRLSSSSMTLPTNIEATKPQKTLGCSFTRVGPGGTPWVISAAISTAVIGPLGRPSASQGPNAAGGAALAERRRMRERTPRDGIGQEARDDMGGAGRDSDQEAEDRAARDRHDRLAPLPPAGQQLAQF